MRETRVYVDSPLESGRRIPLSSQTAQHVAKVLRLRDGAALSVFDGHGGEYRAILRVSGREVAVEVGEHRSIERESPIRLVLLQALARGERMDFVIQKATELGVHRIIPVAAARSVVQLDAERSDKRIHHWQAVAAAACEQ
ncbi:MAG: RsmE family RNA methyltransferase, partial [Steroidobacteraceae bacterium]